jgi:putative transcriptional regulator
MNKRMMDISFENKRKAQKGKILLSDPFSNDDYFGRSVVYLCDHNSEGSFGFVLNNYIDLDLHEIAKNFPNIKTKVSIGGPVETQSIFFLHTLGEKIEGSQLVGDGIYVGGDYSQLLDLIDQKKITNKQIRFFLGYSGWTKGQLQEEIENHAWIVVPVINKNEVMDFNIDKLYEHYMRREGKKYDLLSQFPSDFMAN